MQEAVVKTIGLIPNWRKKNANLVVARIDRFFSQRSIRLNLAELSRVDFYSDTSLADQLADWYESMELIIVVGGDGTILRVARDLACWNLPVLGINMGHKGFLAEIEVEQMERFLQYIATGQFTCHERMMLDTRLRRQDKELAAYLALNDIVISRGPFSRIIEVESYINNDFMESYSGDGLIVATPTGSTGYSLSAGGPIVNPTMQLFVITPICPHSLYNRSVIISGNDLISLQVDSRQVEVMLTVDGQVRHTLEDHDQIIICRSEQTVKLVSFQGYTFFRMLHQKLKV
jgi:NAD+ kinase